MLIRQQRVPNTIPPVKSSSSCSDAVPSSSSSLLSFFSRVVDASNKSDFLFLSAADDGKCFCFEFGEFGPERDLLPSLSLLPSRCDDVRFGLFLLVTTPGDGGVTDTVGLVSPALLSCD